MRKPRSMSEEKRDFEVGAESLDESKTFDMYHFFSRKDVWLAAAVIILLLLAAIGMALSGHHVT